MALFVNLDLNVLIKYYIMVNFNRNIRIGNRMIGMDHPTYFIAEIGANFDGSLDKAKRLIDAAKEAGASM